MDSPTQKLDVELVLQLVRKIGDTLGQGELHQQRVKLGIQLGVAFARHEIGKVDYESIALLVTGGSVLVHCAQGKSRSAALAAAFISWRDGVSISGKCIKLSNGADFICNTTNTLG